MANIKTDFHGEGKPFWFKNGKDTDAQDIGGILDKWSNLRGVTCDGKIAGLKLDGTGGLLRMELQTIEDEGSAIYIVIYDCNNDEVARFMEV